MTKPDALIGKGNRAINLIGVLLAKSGCIRTPSVSDCVLLSLSRNDLNPVSWKLTWSKAARSSSHPHLLQSVICSPHITHSFSISAEALHCGGSEGIPAPTILWWMPSGPLSHTSVDSQIILRPINFKSEGWRWGPAVPRSTGTGALSATPSPKLINL